jgi:hypothetical protein
MTGCTTPVAFLVFNRPEPTARVFAAIRAARPTVLLVVADGPRPDRAGEAERVAAVRAIATAIDWPCDVRTQFADVNLGCKRRISSGLEWVFAEVERAIILEDDCLPSPAFFAFAETMLERYAGDRRVFSVTASNFSGATEADGHYFSNYATVWGWATWRDRWACYDVAPAMPWADLRRLWGHRPLAYLVWRRIFRDLTQGRIDTWDFQWVLTVWRERGLAVRPTVNLVRNIGFGADATHTHDGESATGRLTAWDGDPRRLDSPIGPVAADRARDAIDDRVWAVITPRSVISAYLPWLSKLKRRFT